MTHEELMTDGTQYCCYCGDEKDGFNAVVKTTFRPLLRCLWMSKMSFLKQSLFNEQRMLLIVLNKL